MDASDKVELEARVKASQEVPGTVELSGRTAGVWAEVLEDVTELGEVYAYWVALDDDKPAGYRAVDVLESSPTEIDLDLRYIIEGDTGSL